jgi:hypothetical protein
VISHISWVHTPVKANGKKRRTVLFFPKFSLSLTSDIPDAVLVLRAKSGALDPTEIAINYPLFFKMIKLID